jgi:drug/metabolite transporter (DMT)-like permease
VGALGGVVLLGESIAWTQALGGVVILAGVLLVSRRKGSPRPTTSPPIEG